MEYGGPSLHPLYVLKPWRTGGQVVFPVYDVVLRAIQFDKRNGDELLIVRVHEPWVTFRVARPQKLFPLPDVRFDELVPDWPPAPRVTVGEVLEDLRVNVPDTRKHEHDP